MKSILRGFLWLILALFVIFAIAFGWVYNTAGGLQFILDQARPYVPQQLTFGQVKGSLAQGTQVDFVAWQDDTLAITATNIDFKCHWFEFLFDHYWCPSLQIEKLQVVDRAPVTTPNNTPLEQLPQPSDFSFPFIAKLDQLQIDQLSFRSGPDEQQQQANEQTVENIQLKHLVWQKDSLAIEHFGFAYQDVSIDLATELAPQNEWPISLQLNVNVQQQRLALTLSGDLFDEVTGAINYDGTAKVSGEIWSQFNAGKPQAKLSLAAKPQSLAEWLSGLELTHAKTDLVLNWPAAEVTLGSRLRLQGDEFKLRQSLAFDSVLNWQQSASGRTELSGTLQQLLAHYGATILALEVTGQSQTPAPQEPLMLQANWSLDKGNVSLHDGQLSLATLQANFSANANLTATPYQNLTAELTLSAAHAPTWSQLNFTALNSAFRLTQSRPDQPFTLSAQGQLQQWLDPAFTIEQAKWDIQQNKTINATASISKASIHDTAQPLEICNSELTVKGAMDNHRLTVNSQLGNVAINAQAAGKYTAASPQQPAAWRVDQLKATLLKEQQPLTLTLERGQFAAAKVNLQQLCITQNGYWCNSATLDGQRWSLKSQLEAFDLSSIVAWVKASGAELPFKFAGLLNGTAEISGENQTISQLQVALNSPVLSYKQVDQAVVLTGVGFNSERTDSQYQLNLEWQHIAQQMDFAPYRLISFAEQGQLTAALSALDKWSVRLQQPASSAQLSSFVAAQNSNFVFDIPMSDIDMQFALANNQFSATTALKLFSQDWAKAQWQSSWPLNSASSIAGKAEFSLTEFAWLKRWQSRIDALDLNWQHQTEFSGQLGQPNFTGSGQLNIQQFAMEELGLDIKDSFLKINSIMDTFNLEGVLQNQQGKLDFAGEVKLWPMLSANANISGQQLTIIDSGDQKLVVSPKLTTRYQQGHLDINGDIRFDEAKVTLNKIPQSKVSVSDDQVLLAEETEQPSALSYRVAINLAMGDNTSFAGFGLSSDIEGQLKLLAESQQAVKLEGQLRLANGKFEAYKQVLNIEQGQLIFLGPADNPGVQIAASREVDDIKVGVYADGSLLDPKLTLFSEPALPEVDIVSLLLTGRKVNDLDNNEGSALANAALTLGVEGANRIAQSIGQALGIRNIQVTSSNTADTSRVNIETQVNERLSIGYGTTIDSQNETQAGWIIEYRLTPKLSFEAISGEEVSTALTYKAQFDLDEKPQQSDKKTEKKSSTEEAKP